MAAQPKVSILKFEPLVKKLTEVPTLSVSVSTAIDATSGVPA